MNEVGPSRFANSRIVHNKKKDRGIMILMEQQLYCFIGDSQKNI